VVEVSTVRLEVAEEDIEGGIVIEGGIAFGIGDEEAEDVAKGAGLDDETVVAEESELTLGFELVTSYGFKVGHGVVPYVRLRQSPASVGRAGF
jgi:hypothetical protein